MENVKVFYGSVEKRIEERINEWLNKMGNRIEITRVTQGVSGQIDCYVVISIFYKKKHHFCLQDP